MEFPTPRSMTRHASRFEISDTGLDRCLLLDSSSEACSFPKVEVDLCVSRDCFVFVTFRVITTQLGPEIGSAGSVNEDSDTLASSLPIEQQPTSEASTTNILPVESHSINFQTTSFSISLKAAAAATAISLGRGCWDDLEEESDEPQISQDGGVAAAVKMKDQSDSELQQRDPLRPFLSNTDFRKMFGLS
jgi:hypothetical protein